MNSSTSASAMAMGIRNAGPIPVGGISSLLFASGVPTAIAAPPDASCGVGVSVGRDVGVNVAGLLVGRDVAVGILVFSSVGETVAPPIARAEV